MASPEVTSQPPFSFKFVGIRPDSDDGAPFSTSPPRPGRRRLPPKHAGEPRLALPLSRLLSSLISLPASRCSNGARAPMASPEINSQPPFSFRFVGIRTTAPRSRPPRLAWVVGHCDVVISLAGSSATDGWPPPFLDVTPPHRRHQPEQQQRTCRQGRLRRRLYFNFILNKFARSVARKAMAMKRALGGS
jgi:hypothetical protein